MIRRGAAVHRSDRLEGDQWTFFKFRSLISTTVWTGRSRARVWRPLALHMKSSWTGGRPVLVELDSYFCPTRRQCVPARTHEVPVAVVEIDVARAHMGYFHNQGYYHVSGEDFLNALRLAGSRIRRCCRPTSSS